MLPGLISRQRQARVSAASPGASRALVEYLLFGPRASAALVQGDQMLAATAAARVSAWLTAGQAGDTLTAVGQVLGAGGAVEGDVIQITTLAIASTPPLILRAADILEVGELVLASGGASPGITITLGPDRVPVVWLDPPPLRAPATLSAPGLTYQGLVSAVRLGATLTLTLES